MSDKKVNSNSSSSSGIGVLGLLGVAFVVLKLTGIINWSWWYVTMPFWGGIAIGISLIVLGGLLTVIMGLVSLWSEKREKARRRK